MFAAAVKAVTRRLTGPAPQPKRRRSGESGRAFRPAARTNTQRIARAPIGGIVAAGMFLSDTLDWLNLWHADPGSASAGDDDPGVASSNHLFPHP